MAFENDSKVLHPERHVYNDFDLKKLANDLVVVERNCKTASGTAKSSRNSSFYCPATTNSIQNIPGLVSVSILEMAR